LAGLEVEVVPPGVDFHAIDGIGHSSSLRSDILYTGRLIPKKNLDLLIGAAAQLVERGLDPIVLVAGEGPDQPRLAEQVRRLGLDKFIRLIGRVDSWRGLIEIMKATRVLALPSLREGFGMVVLEAAACGVPTVTVEHRRNAAADLVQDGVTGLIAQPTERAYADALEAVLIDEPKRRAMGQRARASAIHYDWDTTARATEDFYSSALNS
jgi:glycosyltransferase involved in cell wall biosynthesis